MAAPDPAEVPAAGAAFFETHIRPVLAESCYRCHSDEAADKNKLKGGLRLDSKAGMLAGGDTSAVVVPGDLQNSLILDALHHRNDLEMPPKGMLSEEKIAKFEEWVKMGAPDPRGGSGDEAAAPAKVEIDIEKGREFWAFQPIAKPHAPQVHDQSWPRGAIDRFVLAKMELAGVEPVADAGPRALVRRVHFDLVGLPPSAQVVEAFVADPSPQAFAAIVDKLLASPQFGERWGRHWLDVARYAESNGNVRNAIFPHAWRYRDYVIDAFNRDVPYDEFLRQQLAGDLLQSDRPEATNRNLIATGFLALAPKPVAKGNPNFAMDLVGDQIEVTTRAFMALTVSCARCHDHKYDPVPTGDYYALAGIFTSTETLYGGGNNMGAFPATELHTMTGGDANAERRREDRKLAIEQLKGRIADAKVEQRKLTGNNKKQRKRKKGGQAPPNGNAPEPVQDPGAAKELGRQIKTWNAELKALTKSGPPEGDVAMGVRDRAKPGDCRINIRGEANKLGPVSPRGFVQVAMLGNDVPQPSATQSGRLELARWLADPEHPLTSRVMANRVWYHLMGSGIVRTPDNFGLHGDRPSHPQLLDFLARELSGNGWSVKRLIREIVLSRSYALGGGADESNEIDDPENRLFWRREIRRLEAESLRDAMLAASGQLDLSPGEGSVVSKHGGKLVQDALTPAVFHREKSNHRSIYLPIVRNGLPEILNTFDSADPSLVMGKRKITTVPSQALYLINSPFVVEQSNALARLLLEAEPGDESKRISQLYLVTCARPADDVEISRCESYLSEVKADVDDEQAAWASLCQAVFMSSEFRYLD